jgi:hypothetical protein
VNFLLENWLLIFVAVTSGVALLLPNLQNLGAPSLSPTQAVLLMNREKAHIVDVRSPEEFATGHLIGAKKISDSVLRRCESVPMCQFVFAIQSMVACST